MKTCPACRKAIDERAVKCPYCQTEYHGMQMAEGHQEAREGRMFKWLLALAAIIALFYWLSLPGSIESLHPVESGQSRIP